MIALVIAIAFVFGLLMAVALTLLARRRPTTLERYPLPPWSDRDHIAAAPMPQRTEAQDQAYLRLYQQRYEQWRKQREEEDGEQ